MIENFSRSKRRLWWLALVLAPVAGAGIWFLIDTRFYGWSRAAIAQSTLSKDEFEQRVRAYLLANPEVVGEALQRLEERQQAAQAREVKASLEARADEVFRDPASPVGGNVGGDVTLVEFFDYNCHYCRQVAPQVSQAAAKDPNLRIVYKEFPILGPNSIYAAKAALAAQRQGKYGELHRAMMAAKSALTESDVLDAASRLNIDLQRLKTDMGDPAIQATLDRNLALGQALRITGTPGFVIGETMVPGALDLATIERLIREAREKK